MTISGSPKISIGIPTYNRPEGLKRTLDCLINQSFKDFEILISDNCSPGPETGDIGLKYQQKDSRIRYIKQTENKGIWNNFIYVYNETKAPYFMWASDDDIWEEDFLQDCFSELVKNPEIGICISKYKVVSETGLKENDAIPFNDFNRLFLRSKDFSILAYIFLDEQTHKANFFSGVWRRSILEQAIKKRELIFDQNNNYAADIALLTYALCISEFRQSPNYSFIKTYPEDCPGSEKFRQVQKVSFFKSPFSHCYWNFIKSRLLHKSLKRALKEGGRLSVKNRAFLAFHFLIHLLPVFIRDKISNNLVFLFGNPRST